MRVSRATHYSLVTVYDVGAKLVVKMVKLRFIHFTEMKSVVRKLNNSLPKKLILFSSKY